MNHPQESTALTDDARMACTTAQRAGMIENTPWAKELSWNEIETLATYMEAYLIAEGVLILKEGGGDAHMILVTTGHVNIMKQSSDGADKLITSIGPGQSFGEMSLLDGEPRSASAVAATEINILVLGENSFTNLIQERPRLAIKVIIKISKLMSQRLRQTSGRLIDHLE